jgi:hypothetical protein
MTYTARPIDVRIGNYWIIYTRSSQLLKWLDHFVERLDHHLVVEFGLARPHLVVPSTMVLLPMTYTLEIIMHACFIRH